MRKRLPSKLTYLNEHGDELGYALKVDDSGGGFDLRSSPEALSAAVQVHVAWEDLDLARRVILGYSTVKTHEGSGRKYISRSLPLALPPTIAAYADEPGAPLLYASAITRTEGMGPRAVDPFTGFPRFRLAKLHVTFSRPAFYLRPDRYCQPSEGPLAGVPDEALTVANDEPIRHAMKRVTPIDRSVSIPAQVMRFVREAGDEDHPAIGPPLLDAYGVSEPALLLEVTHFSRPDFPLGLILRAIGRRNSEPLYGFPADCLVCQAPTCKTYPGPLGYDIFDITFKWKMIVRVRGGSIPPGGGPPEPDSIMSANHFLKVMKQTVGSPKLDYRKLNTSGLNDSSDVLHKPFDMKQLLRPEQT